MSDLTSGTYAAECIRRLSRRLGTLHGEVLADEDREPLHQLRVSLRRLRTVFSLFGAALVLPEGVSEGRLRTVARRTSLTRDLDVLQRRLALEMAPLLPARERKQLGQALQQLAQDREQAFTTLVEALTGKRYLKLLARLGRWLQDPRYGPTGALPLKPWAGEWLAPVTAGLFLEQGWWAEEWADENLHGLRKRLKAVRYALETLEPVLQDPLVALLPKLRAAQDHLGDLHDLQVLGQGFQSQGGPSWRGGSFPGLRSELEARQRHHWEQWLPLREELLAQRLEIRRGWLLEQT